MKPNVLVCVLTGCERGAWICPDLSVTLWNMSRDTRYDVNYLPVRGARPVETARNITVHAARQLGVDWLVVYDNDTAIIDGPGRTVNPLDIVAEARPHMHIIGCPVGLGADGGDIRYRLYPPDPHGTIEGSFQQESRIASGILMIRKTVWAKISRGPWFRWLHGDSELLLPGEPGECCEVDYFCRLAQENGFRLWNYRHPAAHFNTTDISAMTHTLATLTEQAKGAAR